jgi:hypothetical protein
LGVQPPEKIVALCTPEQADVVRPFRGFWVRVRRQMGILGLTESGPAGRGRVYEITVDFRPRSSIGQAPPACQRIVDASAFRDAAGSP